MVVVIICNVISADRLILKLTIRSSDMLNQCENFHDEEVDRRGMFMRLYVLIASLACCVFPVAGCSKVSEAELQEKINKCAAAGMNYSYLRDFKGDPYEVMCVSKRLR